MPEILFAPLIPVGERQEFLIDGVGQGEAAGHYPDDGHPYATLRQGHARPQRMQNHLKTHTG